MTVPERCDGMIAFLLWNFLFVVVFELGGTPQQKCNSGNTALENCSNRILKK